MNDIYYIVYIIYSWKKRLKVQIVEIGLVCQLGAIWSLVSSRWRTFFFAVGSATAPLDWSPSSRFRNKSDFLSPNFLFLAPLHLLPTNLYFFQFLAF